MELLFLALSAVIFFFFLLHGIDHHRRRRLPPGPAGLPIIGNLLDIGPQPHESLAKLSKKHGPLMTIRLGSITTVVASTPDAAREILQHNDEACSGRIIPDAVTALDNHDAAVIWIPANHQWRTIRKALKTYFTNHLKLDIVRDLRQNVMEGMLDFLWEAGRKKAAVDIGKLAFAVALNQMSNTCLSRNLTSYESDDIGGFNTAVKTLMEVDGRFNIADIFPVLKPLDPQDIRRQAKAAYDWFDQVTEGFIRERLKHRQSNKLSRFGDTLDSLLDYSQDHEADFNLTHIKILLVDIFIAGTETNSSTTAWAMTELLLNPHMFSRLREEVSTIVGEDGKIQEAKILDLPYLQAVIKETLRLHLPVPLLVPHKTETEVKLGKYIIPKNTRILVNAWSMARDPMYWENPLTFNPERFFENEQIEYKGQHFKFIPFGSGRRMCPGISFAHRVVSLTVASFVYHFDWKLPHAREEMDMNTVFGLTLLRATPLVAIPLPIKLGT
ncbi:cytochrome P450 76T24 [Lactuca sativa]|uniref:Cytochrome P450 n=1 Tax=Lactuca sativa TaxID=4236 RepID=A0A9R1XLG0_LACSA|nr:cytochrome P450 76T24 [Lactuca sativa]KAJ0217506.1 hypothetical protein LSAT_V11C300103300 [Lactuca sativa]